MATSVVVATVVTSDLNEAICKDRLLEQIRRNDSDLRAKLVDADTNANVVTAILNVDEFMQYVHEWSKREEKASEGNSKRRVADTTIISDGLSELEFMEHTLQQLRSNGTNNLVALDDEVLAAMEAEQIGEDFSRYPFCY